jgi:cytochrome P450
MSNVEVDFADPGFVRDPHPVLGLLREQAPVSWHAPTGRWLASSHAAAGAVLRDRRLGRFWRDREPAERWDPFNLLHRNQMMENEPPAHTRLRSLVAKAFGRGQVEGLRPAVAAEAASLVAAAGTEFDLLTDVAEPLAVTVIAELLGVPEVDRHRLRPWSAAIVRMYEVNRVVVLLRHPGELARLCAERALVRTAVEEMIRYDRHFSFSSGPPPSPWRSAG